LLGKSPAQGDLFHPVFWWKGKESVFVEQTGPMENKPMSPVPVVFLSMLSGGPSEVRRSVFPSRV
jgi:hypothetical protein